MIKQLYFQQLDLAQSFVCIPLKCQGSVLLHAHLQHHNNTMIKTQWQRQTQEDFLQKYLPLTLLQGFEKVVWGFTVGGSWRPNITESYGRQRCVFLVL